MATPSFARRSRLDPLSALLLLLLISAANALTLSLCSSQNTATKDGGEHKSEF
jgi:hypothetical protein